LGVGCGVFGFGVIGWVWVVVFVGVLEKGGKKKTKKQAKKKGGVVSNITLVPSSSTGAGSGGENGKNCSPKESFPRIRGGLQKMWVKRLGKKNISGNRCLTTAARPMGLAQALDGFS